MADKTSTHIPSFALIIGAAKSGTTSLFEYLSRHPEIARCKHNEPCFFSRDALMKKGIEWYESLWNWNPEQHKHALEASTGYTKRPNFPNVAERIAQFDRNFKFIYIIRNPIDRIESHLTHGLAAGWAERPEKPSDLDHAIHISRYAMQLKAYLEQFPKENILLVAHNELKHNPRTLLDRIYRFLNVDPKHNLELLERHNTSENRYRDHPAVKSLRKIQPLADVVKWYVPRTLVETARRWLGQPFDERIELTDPQRQYVLEELEDDLNTLNSTWGFDPDSWDIDRS